jgi:hypothetical protein
MTSYLFSIVQAYEPALWALFIASCFLLVLAVVCAALPTPTAAQIVELIERDRSPFADRETDR